MDPPSLSGFTGSDQPGETTPLRAEQADRPAAPLQPAGAKAPLGMDYVPSEEERRVFQECNQESFWYRSVPISVSSMALTQFLISRGTLTASPRFGSVPKVLFAGACGYFAGKLSYMKTCQEKFKRLENSRLGEALRQRAGHRPPFGFGQSELNEEQRRSEISFQSDSQNTHSAQHSYPQSKVKKNKYGDTWEE
ncbi:hypothetical protein AOLI_G00199030 [Acnodon oligacanthus]